MNLIVSMRQIKDLTPSEREVLNFILERPQDVVTLRISELASLSYTSTSTCMRFVNKLGFDSYTNFRIKLASDVKAYLSKEFVYSEALPFEQENSTDQILNNVSQMNADAIMNSAQMNRVAVYENIAKLLDTSDSIDFYGIGESLNIAQDTVSKAMRLGLHATVYADQGMQLTQSAIAAKNRIAFLISYTGETDVVLRIARNLANNGIKTISLTSGTDNQLAKMADYNLFVEATDTVYTLGHMSSRMAMLNVLDILLIIYANRNYAETLEILHRTYNYKSR